MTTQFRKSPSIKNAFDGKDIPQKRPWLQFYPSDWRGDPKLRLCSLAARGLWMEMLCLMHSAEPRGYLSVAGRPMSARMLASQAGCSEAEVKELTAELRDADVFSVSEDSVIFSRRMVRDDERSRRNAANGKTGGNPLLSKSDNRSDNRLFESSVKRSVGESVKPHIPYARVLPSQGEKDSIYTEEALGGAVVPLVRGAGA